MTRQEILYLCCRAHTIAAVRTAQEARSRWLADHPGDATVRDMGEMLAMLDEGFTMRGEFKPSQKARARVWELVAREKEGTLTEDEKYELDHYAQVEHIMRLVKAQARKRLKRPS